MPLRAALIVLVLPFAAFACGGRTVIQPDAEVEGEDAQSLDATRDAEDAEPPAEDAGFEEGDGGLSAGEICDTSDECADGLRCLYWDPGCDRRGICGVPPGLDGSASCRAICSCEGHWEPGHVTTEPFQSRSEWGPNTSDTCGPPDASVPDGWDPFARNPGCRD